MTHFMHTLRLYARRFWREMAAFWIISGIASYMSLRGPGNYPHAGLTVLEALALLCAVVRLMQAENVFRTLGGWQARPIRGATLRRARWTLLAVLLAPAVAGRVAVTALTFPLGTAEWLTLATAVWLPLLAGIVLGAAAAGWIGRDARWSSEYHYPALVWGVILTAGGMALGWKIAGHSRVGTGWSGGGGAAQLLIAGTGDLENVRTKTLDSMTPILRLPLHAGASAEFAGCRATITECAGAGLRVMALLEITAPAASLRPWLASPGSAKGESMALLIRYSDGSWARAANRMDASLSSSLPGLSAEKFTLGGSFASPLILPENDKTLEQLCAGAELVFFVRQPRSPAGPAPQDWVSPPAPGPPQRETPPQTDAARRITEAMRNLSADRYDRESRTNNALAAAGAEGVPLILAQNWGEYHWQDIARPILELHVTAAHLPLFLENLQRDPRLGEVMIAKGWAAQALPTLREHLQNGLPLGPKSLTALAALKDPALAAALTAALQRTGITDPKVLTSVRDHPGVDWPALAAEAWRWNNFRTRDVVDAEHRNPWTWLAAAAGHRPAFQSLAARWCLTPPGLEEIRSFIPTELWDGSLSDFPAWLRANFDHLAWDTATSRWRTEVEK